MSGKKYVAVLCNSVEQFKRELKDIKTEEGEEPVPTFKEDDLRGRMITRAVECPFWARNVMFPTQFLESLALRLRDE